MISFMIFVAQLAILNHAWATDVIRTEAPMKRVEYCSWLMRLNDRRVHAGLIRDSAQSGHKSEESYRRLRTSMVSVVDATAISTIVAMIVGTATIGIVIGGDESHSLGNNP